MKSFKITMFLLLITILLGIVSTNASSGYKGYAGVVLNANKSSYITKGPEYKYNDTEQHYNSIGTIDNITAADIKMRVRVKNSGNATSTWKTLSRGETKSFGTQDFSIFSGYYNIQMSRNSTSLIGAKATHSGSWYLD